MHDCAASFSRQNIVEILSFHLWGVYYGRSEGGVRHGYAGHHLRALQRWPTNRSTHLKDWSCHRSGLYYESGDDFLLQELFLGVLLFTVSCWGQTTPQIAHNVSQIFVNLR